MGERDHSEPTLALIPAACSPDRPQPQPPRQPRSSPRFPRAGSVSSFPTSTRSKYLFPQDLLCQETGWDLSSH